MSNLSTHEHQTDDSGDRRRRELLAEEQPEVNTFNPNKTRLGRRLLLGSLAIITAGGLVAGGVALGNRGGNAEAKAPPVATAPANPGQPSAAATETQPTPSSAETVPASSLTAETFPLVGADGETFKGTEEFAAKNQLLARDYDIDGTDASKKPVSDLIHDFTAQRTAWINSGLKQSATGDFDGYSYPYTDPVLGSSQTAKGEDAVRRTYDGAYADAFVSDTDFAGNIDEVHKTVSQFNDSDPSYAAKYTVSGTRGSAPEWLQSSEGVTFMNVKTTYTGKGATGEVTTYVSTETLNFKPVIQDDGTLAYEVVSATQEPAGE